MDSIPKKGKGKKWGQEGLQGPLGSMMKDILSVKIEAEQSCP